MVLLASLCFLKLHFKFVYINAPTKESLRHCRCASHSFIDRMEDSRDLGGAPGLENIFYVNEIDFNMEAKSENSVVDFLVTNT